VLLLAVLACQPQPPDAWRPWPPLAWDSDGGLDDGEAGEVSWDSTLAEGAFEGWSPGSGRDDDAPLGADRGPASRDAAEWPFTADSPWNTPLGDGARFERAGAPCTADLRREDFDAWINAEEWSHPVYRAEHDDPLVELREEGELSWTARAPAGATPALPEPPHTDAHLHIISPDGRYVDEMWLAEAIPEGWDAESLARVDLWGPGVDSGGVRVYGGSAIAGLIRGDELTRGIRHALSLSLDMDLLRPGWVWPATLESRRAEDEYLGQVPTGQLVAIPPEHDLEALGLSPVGLAVGRALQDYGAYVTDHAGATVLYAEPGLEADIDPARDDMDLLRSLMACVTNNTEQTPGGPGARRAPPAPPLVLSDL